MPESNDIGALWKRESQKGEKYLKGSVTINGEKLDIVIFPNRYKKDEKHPDYRIMLSEQRVKQEPKVVKEDDFPDDLF